MRSALAQVPPSLFPERRRRQRLYLRRAANDFLRANAPAATVVTSQPTQYLRVYCAECKPPSVPNRSFMAEPSIIRGLKPEEIKDVLALPTYRAWSPS